MIKIFLKRQYSPNLIFPNSNFLERFEKQKNRRVSWNLIQSQFGLYRFALEPFFMNVSHKRKNLTFDEIFKGQYDHIVLFLIKFIKYIWNKKVWALEVTLYNPLMDNVNQPVFSSDLNLLEIFQIAKKYIFRWKPI